jgi:hypothetical protein
VKYFAQDANRASMRTKVYATIYEGFGTPQEKVTRKTVTLRTGKEMHEIAAVGWRMATGNECGVGLSPAR